MNEDYLRDVAQRSGISTAICKDLLEKGWAFYAPDDGRAMWVAPTADLQDYVPHNEPNCDSTCGRLDPHKHGLPCHKACKICSAVCHPDCPAYKESENA